ncbi:MAG: prolyl oligopeptidase family serine peptidase [Candidatus Eisenbacteria bacterium]|nr:prolyl oligopeptidase family serine peptidase [Candidatus Latescibacterota bacterium]MBD3301944.1 prolyl oligopeptidase family serine peptidase [Candidatus Eisenbacteria bacterium]
MVRTLAVWLLAALVGLAAPAASSPSIEEILEEVDPWVVEDTTRILTFIEAHNAKTKETLEGSPRWSSIRRDLAALFGVDYIGSPTIDETGRIVFQMRITGDKAALFYVDRPWSWPIQITPNGWTDRGLEIGNHRIDPEGRFLYLQVMVHGDENWDLYRFERDGTHRVLLEDRSVRYGLPHIVDDDSFFFSIDNREQMWLAQYTVSTGIVDTLYTEPGAFFPVDHLDGRILCLRYLSFSEGQLIEFDTETGTVREITEPHLFWSADYTRDGRVVALTDALSDEEEFMKLAMFRPGDRPVAPEEMHVVYDPGVETDGVFFQPESGEAFLALNRDGYSDLVAVELEGKVRAVPMPGVGIVDGLHANRLGQLVFDFSSPSTPPAAFYHERDAKTPRPIGRVSDFGYDFSDVQVEVIRYPSTDGTEIPALLYLPPGVEKDGANPCIVEYHGGPPGQSRPWFQRNIAFGLSRGVIYLFPNVRGSTGYGPAWERADNLENRFQALEDAEAAIDHLHTAGWSRPERTAIWGASYGGYTVNYLSVHAPEKFACAVSEVGIADIDWTNLHSDQTFLAGWEKEMGEVGSPLTRRLSPLWEAEAITRPLLLTAGFNDPRVPASGPRRFAAVLDRLGKDVLYYEEVESGHGAIGKSAAIDAYARVYTFLFDHILSD